MASKKKGEIAHIDYAVVAKAHSPMYLMHKYWARKPHNVVAEYIKTYTKEGDIVLDPFCGSGVTPIETIKLGRKGIGIDLDPMATFITRMTAMPADINKLKEAFEAIKNNCKSDINALYRTACKRCTGEATTICTHFENSIPLKIYYYCKNCNKKLDKKPEDEDLKLIKKIENLKISYWFPTQRLAYDGNEFKEGTHDPNIDSVDKLFTKRNLIALSILFNQIINIKDSKIQELFKFAFTSMSHLSSKLTPVRPTRPMSSFWAMHRYWLPPVYMESNVWHLFYSAIYGRQGIIEGKTYSNSQINYYKEAKKFSNLNDGANFFVKTHNALQLMEIIPKESVDYVFTDPPYGGAVQYFELSTLWASWLGMGLDYKDEVTINPQQNKDFDYYHKMLTAAFRQVYEVLKKGKYMTVTFHSIDIKVWTSIIKAVVLAGFDLEKIIYQPPARPSAKGLLQPYGSAVGDYYIMFRKPEVEKTNSEAAFKEELYDRVIVESAKQIIAERGEPTMYQHILNGIIVELKKEGVLLGAKTNPDEVMKKHLNNEFVLVDVKDEKGKKIGSKWWLKDVKSVAFLEAIPLMDRVETAIVNVLNRKVKVSFDDVLQEIFINFPNALTPDTQDINEVLEEYSDKTADGAWSLKPSVKARQSEHSEMIYNLAVLGEKLGYDVWIGQNEQSDMHDGKKLSEFMTNERLILRFIPTIDKDSVKQIDVLWHDEGRVRYAFEVENTTAITEAIIRGAHIRHNEVPKVIVIPREREKLLHKKLQEPVLKQSVTDDNWKFMFYNDVRNLSKKRKTNIEEFEKAFKLPKEKQHIQNTLNDF